jgi:hypothetical protein
MNKDKLKEILLAIVGEYELTDFGKDYIKEVDINNSVDDYVECLGLSEEDLRSHLLKTELVPTEDELNDSVKNFSNAIEIISEFMGNQEILHKYLGFYRLNGFLSEPVVTQQKA